jgi:hypothetical protein
MLNNYYKDSHGVIHQVNYKKFEYNETYIQTYNNLGINSMGGYSIATIERAFLDVIYLNKQYHFDNLRLINWEKVSELLPIYGGNKRMEITIKRLKHTIK